MRLPRWRPDLRNKGPEILFAPQWRETNRRMEKSDLKQKNSSLHLEIGSSNHCCTLFFFLGAGGKRMNPLFSSSNSLFCSGFGNFFNSNPGLETFLTRALSSRVKAFSLMSSLVCRKSWAGIDLLRENLILIDMFSSSLTTGSRTTVPVRDPDLLFPTWLFPSVCPQCIEKRCSTHLSSSILPASSRQPSNLSILARLLDVLL